jgi:hypothetical protein
MNIHSHGETHQLHMPTPSPRQPANLRRSLLVVAFVALLVIPYTPSASASRSKPASYSSSRSKPASYSPSASRSKEPSYSSSRSKPASYSPSTSRSKEPSYSSSRSKLLKAFPPVRLCFSAVQQLQKKIQRKNDNNKKNLNG